jgi:hypothetical protein
MSEANNVPDSAPAGGPASRPQGDGLPPKTGGDVKRPGGEDSVDTGMLGEGEGDRGADAGGMEGEG